MRATPDNDMKLNRRRFIQFAAATSAATGVAALALRTDAQQSALQQNVTVGDGGGRGDGAKYQYSMP